MAEQTSTALATREVHRIVTSPSLRAQIEKALPKHLTPDRLLRMAATMIQKTPGLADCTELSLAACIVECAQLGLEPDSVLGEIFFIPFKGIATIIVGYKGFLKLIFQTGEIYKVTAHVVRKGDKFGVEYGTRPELVHVPKPHGDEKDDANWVGAYAVLHYRDGHSDFEYLERADVFARRSRSSAWRGKKPDSPWFTDPASMWKKSAIRAAANRAPKSTTDNRLARAVALDELADSDRLIPGETGFTIADAVPEAQTAPLKIADEKPAEQAVKKEKPGKKKPEEKKREPGDEQQPIEAEVVDSTPLLTAKEYNLMFQTGQKSGWSVDEIQTYLAKNFGTSNPAKIHQSKLAEIMAKMEAGT